MILSICPNPSIDCTIELDSLNVGKLNRIDNKVETYSGKGLNVAKAVARLNKKSIATGFMFDEHKSMFEKVLTDEKVDFDFVYSQGGTRVNYKIIDKKSMLTELNDKGDEVSRGKQLELINKVKSLSASCSAVSMSGSLPQGVSPDFYGEVVAVIPDDVKVIIDTETDNMLCALNTKKVYMVKPNLYEFEKFTGEIMHTKKDMIRASKKYLDYGVKYVLLSIGSDGALLTDGCKHYFCKSASVAVNSTVGAGDCMVAAAAVAMEEGLSDEELLLSAVAAGTSAVTTSGTNLFYRDKYLEILSKIYVEKL